MNGITASIRRQRLEIFVYISVIILQLGKADEYESIAGEWKVMFDVNDNLDALHIRTSNRELLKVKIYDVGESSIEDLYFQFHIDNHKIARVNKSINLNELDNGTWQGNITVDGIYFGYTQLYVTLNDPQNSRTERSNQSLDVIVVRDKHINENVLTYTSAAITLLMFINLGSVMDLKRLSSIFLRPIGPILGFCCRYIIMPGLALGLGALMFKDDKHLQLALLFCAVAPSGGIANIFNVFLKGNVNLSLATTTVNSILALGMLPLWIYLMGPVLYSNHTFDLPFLNLALGCIGLCLALIIGVTLRIFIPKTTNYIFRLLKPACVVLSLCLIGVTVGINYYIFKEINLMIFLASLCLPAIGYVLSFALSKLLCRTNTDSMTIGIETSVINMSLPIILLQYSVDQPLSDMLTVVPVTASLVSLCLVVIFYMVRRIFGWNVKSNPNSFDEKEFLVDGAS